MTFLARFIALFTDASTGGAVRTTVRELVIGALVSRRLDSDTVVFGQSLPLVETDCHRTLHAIARGFDRA